MSILRTGLGVPLHKSGDRNNLDNYRTVVLLPLVSRLLGRIISRRVMVFAEREQFFSCTQFGNRSGRSVQDALFLSRTVLELAAEVAHNPALSADDLHPLTVLLFDIQTAFPSVNRQAAFRLFGRLGFPKTLLSVLDSLHAGTLYQITTSQGLSDHYTLSSGFREGCSTSPCLYTLFHDHAMKDFATQANNARTPRPDNYVELHSLGGRPLNKRMTRNTIPTERKLRQSAWPLHKIPFLDLTFADDTTLFCCQQEHQFLEDLLAQVLDKWGETLKSAKTKRLLVGPGATPEHFVSQARLLGCILSSTVQVPTLRMMSGGWQLPNFCGQGWPNNFRAMLYPTRFWDSFFTVVLCGLCCMELNHIWSLERL